MPRPREFDQADVVEAAKNSFWADGYEGTSMVELERSTGLNRSSLYLAFGAKRRLFDAALDAYMESFIGPRIGTMEGASPGLAKIASFFAGIKAHLLENPALSQRGCMMVNAIAELAGHDQGATDRGTAYRDHLRGAFTHALEGVSATGDGARDAVGRRASLLTAATFGIWVSARLDPSDAAELCDAIVAEVGSWAAPAP